eukprot:3736067-Rhodomonas_salina.2
MCVCGCSKARARQALNQTRRDRCVADFELCADMVVGRSARHAETGTDRDRGAAARAPAE